MAICFKNGEAFLSAQRAGGEDKAKVIEAYKKSGQGFVEGDNEFIGKQAGYIKFFDEKPAKKAEKAKGKKK